MSIIYDAIKKLENKDKTKLPGNKKIAFGDNLLRFSQWLGKCFTCAPQEYTFLYQNKKRNFLLLVLLVSILIFAFGIQYFKKKVVKETNITQAKGPLLKADSIAETDVVGSKEDISRNYVLEGIIYDQLAPLAIINGKILKKYDKIDDLGVINITPNSVELLNPKDNTILTLTL